MRLYGKTLTEVFQLLPWPYKIVVTMGTAFFIFAVPYSLNFFFSLGVYTQKVGPMAFPGLPRHISGILDPSIATDDKGQALMAHTTMEAVADEKIRYSTNVVLERSKTPCRTWATMSSGYYAQHDEAVMDDGNKLPPGIWVAETPSVVYDPNDPGKQWKLFVYEYYWTGDEALARIYSFIGMKTAAALDGEWSVKDWILSAKPDWPPKPYSTLVKQNINTLHKDLANIQFYSRPSVINYKGILFMSLSAFTNNTKTPDRVVLLASTDHGATWGYRGTPFHADDVQKMGNYTQFTGASLISHKGDIYLAGVFGNNDVAGLGTFVMPFESPSGLFEAKLQRDEKTGAPVLAKWIKRQSMEPSKVGGGHAAFSDRCDLGVLVSEYSDIRKSFQIFKTYQSPVGE